MSDSVAIPPALEVEGTLEAPSSKSATNRALVLAALSNEPVEIVRPLESQDTAALERCLAAMGARVERTANGLLVGGPLRGPEQGEAILDAGESGTAARFLAALAAATPGRFLLTGAPGLLERPMEELVRALISTGASLQYRDRAGFLPLAIGGRRWDSGRVRVDASRSSQFLSALLLAAPAARGPLEVEAAGELVSIPYVTMTLESLRAFGHSVDEGPHFRVQRGDRRIRRYDVPGDYSSAIALFAAVGVAGGEVRIRHLTWPTADADAGALPALEAMGLTVHAEPGVVRVERAGPLRAARVRATDFPDAVPALAALAAFAPGESRFEGIGHLRWKESDRIEALASLITRAGGDARSEPEALVVTGPISLNSGPPRRLPTANDHRIAMAGALLCLGRSGLLLEDPGCVAKSYPCFFRDLESLVRRSPGGSESGQAEEP